jgi:hypothetical protein
MASRLTRQLLRSFVVAAEGAERCQDGYGIPIANPWVASFPAFILGRSRPQASNRTRPEDWHAVFPLKE